MARPVWYRSAAIAGAVYINEVGRTVRMNVEAFLFTFGQGAADAARTAALAAAAVAAAHEMLAIRGVQVIRIFTEAAEHFTPVDPAVSKGLGGYRVGIRAEDATVGKVDVRYRRSLADIVGAVLELLTGWFPRGR